MIFVVGDILLELLLYLCLDLDDLIGLTVLSSLLQELPFESNHNLLAFGPFLPYFSQAIIQHISYLHLIVLDVLVGNIPTMRQ